MIRSRRANWRAVSVCGSTGTAKSYSGSDSGLSGAGPPRYRATSVRGTGRGRGPPVGKSAPSIDRAALAEIVDRWAEVEAELTAPGAPFATEEAIVRGERMLVYADRPRS